MTTTARQADIKFNYHDYTLLPEDKRCELIEGDFFMTPAPTTTHQKLIYNLLLLLGPYIQQRGLGLILPAPTDVIFSDEDVLQPDILFVSSAREGIVHEEGIRGAPDLVIEILSPSTAARDLGTKRKLYARYGVREYWIADPAAKTIEVTTWSEKGFKTVQVYPSGTSLHSPLFPDLSLPTGEIFGR